MGYKIFAPFAEIKLSEFCEKMKNIGEILIGNNIIYVWLTKKGGRKKLEELIQEIMPKAFLTDMTRASAENEPDFIKVWFLERFNKQEVEMFNKKHQKELQQMMENINKAHLLLDEKIKKYKEEQDRDGRGREEKTGSAKKDSNAPA